jgi:hypothetical protein
LPFFVYIQGIVIMFLVQVGVNFDGSADGYSCGRVWSMTFMEPDPIDWFVMQEKSSSSCLQGECYLVLSETWIPTVTRACFDVLFRAFAVVDE